MPTVHDRTRIRRFTVLQSTFVERYSSQRASAVDNRHSVNSLHTTRRYDHTWDDLPLSHTSPHQWCHEVDCNLHGIISRAVIEAAALNWLNNNDQGLNRPRPVAGATEHVAKSFMLHFLWETMGTNVVSSMRLFPGFQGVAGATEHAAN